MDREVAKSQILTELTAVGRSVRGDRAWSWAAPDRLGAFTVYFPFNKASYLTVAWLHFSPQPTLRRNSLSLADKEMGLKRLSGWTKGKLVAELKFKLSSQR